MATKSTTIEDTFALYAEMGLRTYEDIAEANCAEGWGCKCCGKLHSASWWTCPAGDIYCTGCKDHMAGELRIKFTAFPTREESGLTRTVERTYDENSQGFEVAAFQRQEHERIYGYC